MTVEHFKFWCSICQKKRNAKCPRSPQEFAQIGLEIGIFKEDFTDSPFDENHPQTLKHRKRSQTLKSSTVNDINLGANVPVNQDTTMSTSDLNDSSGVSKNICSGVC